jgi:Ni,Fe-hydrogenase I cytochrome b subunit
MTEINKTKTIILLIIFVILGGLILYKEDLNKENFSPLNYVFKR